MTSAPRSARIPVANGPATTRDRSRTRTPTSTRPNTAAHASSDDDETKRVALTVAPSPSHGDAERWGSRHAQRLRGQHRAADPSNLTRFAPAEGSAMSKSLTQLEAARANLVTPEMERVAERECVTP